MKLSARLALLVPALVWLIAQLQRALPLTWDEVEFFRATPIFVQLCAIFASGIGWQSLFQASTGGAP